ncbi:hypothetical protein FSP39_019695 [Pinctada imbricata]|uniref:Ferric-chelate reductase 1 n=1 Tax=Pinctada imbricata TaxID=66713 RepID=A0AA88Y1D6_PINIB|nr:hypothetical protein FSP39_019695 [Pinctada imbricata]
MFPKHKGAQAIQSESPFHINLSKSSYTPGEEINITLSADDRRAFIGLQIKAHKAVGDKEIILGTFTSFPSDKLKPVDCFGESQNLITHKNNLPVTEVQLSWQAPPVNEGDIIFTATFVEDFRTFWIHVEARLNSTTPYVPLYTPKVSPITPEIDFDQCGATFGCVLYPTYCTGDDCTEGLTFRYRHDHITFQLFAKADNYVVVGFSHDKKMGEDQTIGCTASNIGVSIQHGWNHPDLYNARIYLGNSLSNMTTMEKDGMVYCSFTRPMVMSLPHPEHPNVTFKYDLNQDYYVMLAKGHTYRGSDVLGYHTQLPVTTWSKVNFKSHEIYRAGSLPLLTKIHAVLMISAWIFFAGLATTMARYYRHIGNTSKGTATWFKVHRFAAIMVFLCAAAAIVIIFLKVKDITTKAVTHGWFGIAVLSALLIQVLSAIFRPEPHEMSRPVFNFGHWFFGKTAQVLAADKELRRDAQVKQQASCGDILALIFYLLLIFLILSAGVLAVFLF